MISGVVLIVEMLGSMAVVGISTTVRFQLSSGE